MRIISIALITFTAFLLFACGINDEKQIAESVYYNGNIYTVAENEQVEAVATLGGTILFAGSKDELQSYIGEGTTQIDLEGMTMTPGFIESHGHFMGLGMNELELDLMGIKNYDEMVEMVKEAVAKAEPGEWILGRGWHQSKWDEEPDEMVKGFQTHDKLSAVSPDNPVYLRHASGHAGFANARAMEIAGVNQMSIESMSQEMEGGEIIRDENGNPTGIFSERAQGVIYKYIPANDLARNITALELAIKASHRNGITSFHDAGVGQGTIDLYQSFKDQGKLGVRLHVMVSGPDRELTKAWLEKGPMIDTADHFLTVRSIKLNCDGALGNRGAWLLEEYTDMAGEFGMETLPMDYVLEVSKAGLQKGFQVCAHAIGDRANQEVLDRYELAFKEFPEIKNHRFRIEHAQHLHPDDIPRFAEMGVIPAMQAIHMSSDRPWAIDRLGEKRIVEGAYMWQTLLKSGAKVINGTDVPVEPINPIASYYASVSRKTLKGEPEGGYEPAEKMTRAQALRSYTLDAAYGEFEEDFKGSIEVGKAADFAVFSQDLMTIEESEILSTEVIMTIVNGKIVYQLNK
ncbi:MAG: amidohydrolase [Bacteroidetes bacterium]|nr:MAG: amidohydrolase [Bacteroidota bacterium]